MRPAACRTGLNETGNRNVAIRLHAQGDMAKFQRAKEALPSQHLC